MTLLKKSEITEKPEWTLKSQCIIAKPTINTVIRFNITEGESIEDIENEVQRVINEYAEITLGNDWENIITEEEYNTLANRVLDSMIESRKNGMDYITATRNVSWDEMRSFLQTLHYTGEPEEVKL